MSGINDAEFPLKYSRVIRADDGDMTIIQIIGLNPDPDTRDEYKYIVAVGPEHDNRERHEMYLDEMMFGDLMSEINVTNSHWKLVKKPNTEFRSAETGEALNRRQRRALVKKLKRIKANDLR